MDLILVQLFGYVLLTVIAYHFLCFCWLIFRGYILTKLGYVKDLCEYGKWAVVTGATDGIGKEYAKQLARKGLNIVLMSRNLSKLQSVADEIKKESNVEIKIILSNFTTLTDYSEIKNILFSLDIGILVNNVGMAYGSFVPFHETDMHRVCDIINVNIFPAVQLTNIVLEGMVERKRGAIIHISSGSILLDVPYFSIYPATKRFIEKFAMCMQKEYCGIVDHQHVIPCYVSTNMSQVKPMFTIPTAEEYVTQAIRTIGVLGVTCGYWSHEFLYAITSFLPNCIIHSIVKRRFGGRLKGN